MRNLSDPEHRNAGEENRSNRRSKYDIAIASSRRPCHPHVWNAMSREVNRDWRAWSSRRLGDSDHETPNPCVFQSFPVEVEDGHGLELSGERTNSRESGGATLAGQGLATGRRRSAILRAISDMHGSSQGKPASRRQGQDPGTKATSYVWRVLAPRVKHVSLRSACACTGSSRASHSGNTRKMRCAAADQLSKQPRHPCARPAAGCWNSVTMRSRQAGPPGSPFHRLRSS